MGPNDASHIIWALGEFLFFFFGASLFFTINMHCNMPIMHHGGAGSQQQGKQALGEFFFVFFFYASLCLTVNMHCNMPIMHHGGAGSWQQGK